MRFIIVSVIALMLCSCTSTGGVDAVASDVVVTAPAVEEVQMDEPAAIALIPSDARRDYDTDSAFAVFRQLGTDMPIYRSASPADGDANAIFADYLMEVAGVTYVINLDADISGLDPSSYYAELYEDGAVLLVDCPLPGEEGFAEAIATVLEAISSHPDDVILIHSADGFGPVGIVSALLEALSGASYDEVLSSYMAPYMEVFGLEEGDATWDQVVDAFNSYLVTINGRAFPLASLPMMVEAYVTGPVGLDGAGLEALQAVLSQSV